MIDSLALLRDLGACDGPEDAIPWAAGQPDTSPAALWATCPRADWMAWYLGRLARGTRTGSPEHRRATLIAVLCARTTTHLIPEPHRAEIEGALSQIEAWAWGDDTVDRSAAWSRISRARGALWRAYAAADADADAAYAAAAYAATAAADADAADAAYAAVYAAYAATADAAYAAVYAAYAAAATATADADAATAAATAAVYAAYAATAAAVYAAYAATAAATAAARRTARARHLAEMADLIRSVIPTAPLPASEARHAA